MPKGFEGVKQAAASVEARRSQGGGPSALWFRLGAGNETVVRFLEQGDDIHWAMMHEVPVEGRSYGRPVPCLDQDKEGTPCPGCERELKLTFKGYINLIWDDAPVFKREESGKMVRDSTGDPVVLDNKPQVAVWSSGIRLFEELSEIDANFKGLTSRRFKVKRKGEGLSTKYSISPVDIDSGPEELSATEQELRDSKFDLNAYVTPGSYEEFMEELGESTGSADEGAENGAKVNPFMKNK